MKNTINIALFDMDSSLADYEDALLRDLEILRGPLEEKLTQETLWLADRDLPHIRARIELIKSIPGWWFCLEPIEIGMKALNLAKSLGFDVHVLTKGPKRHSRAWDEKVQWCQKYLDPEVDIHVTSDKGLVYGKLLYDDYPAYMERWLEHRHRGLGIMPVTPTNKDFRHPNVLRWDGSNHEQLVAALTAARDRGPGEELDTSWNK